jgi:hypothetical protein
MFKNRLDKFVHAHDVCYLHSSKTADHYTTGNNSEKECDNTCEVSFGLFSSRVPVIVGVSVWRLWPE